jgi:hypothetical protein
MHLKDIHRTTYYSSKKTDTMPGIHKKGRLHKVMLVAIIMAATVISSLAQDTIQVKGIVYSNTNKPLPDVSVSIAGSFQRPVITSESGEFTLTSVSGNDWLIISPTGGSKVKRVYVNNRKELKIYLTPGDLTSGDDELSVLSRPVLKRNMVAAYTDLEIRNIPHTGELTIDQHLQGNAAGVNVVNRSGAPGSGAYVAVRGLNSINTNNQPLYVIDGIPVTSHGVFNSNLDGYSYNPLVELNLYDISKAEVIKDPAITAAYGSKASNGLVLIETLDPSVTQTTIELELKSGLSLSPSNLIPQLNAGQHKTLMQEVLFSSGKFEEVIQQEYPALFITKDDERYIDFQHNTNWQELIFKNSFFNNMNINVKGGDEIASYGLSFGLINNKGTIKTTGYNGYNLRFVSRLNIFTWLKMNAGVALNYNSSRMKEAATVNETSPILTSLAKSPLLNPYQYDIQGQRITTLAEVDELGVQIRWRPSRTMKPKTTTTVSFQPGFELSAEPVSKQ